MESHREPNAPDALTQASITIAWIIALNKPFYPLYVWWFSPDAAKASIITLISFPAFILVPIIARYSGYYARLALVCASLADTVFETKFFGPETGTELFLAPCMMLAAMSFRKSETWTGRMTVGLVFATFAALHGRYGAPLIEISPTDQQAIYAINVFAIASLMAFFGLRFPKPD
jgi:hypothetical protein